ncbi:hypothetical protein CCAX7_51460 [Capsulimonas corticalis]|uniref:PA14 domain-containing protein n=1 Tax=Capsulimonas corticalis TaxID=2219043 RepID=A0A402CPH7_9BACT|nr:glycoside hydrolase family 3 C-terminal domain-containing protein [Capsulimonas corticalis]BDI33095.1 hypothetical protein CCAX7_51460 [Capsulimonas corticalis]
MNRRRWSVYAFALLLLAAVGALETPLNAETTPPGSSALEKQVDDVLKQMTLEEKVSLCSGTGPSFRGVARLHIPDLQLTDGPRGPHGAGPTTAFPSGVMFGATWNPDLIQAAGKVMGEETRAGGQGILLGPGINIQRDPLGGRFFEYYTEDPYLNGHLATANVRGIQSEGVAACIKHYVCNNREDNRNNYMSMVDSRTLHEIYLPGFKAAVQDGHAWSVMTSANGVNGDFVSDSRVLLNGILKGEWGFDGMVLTDWLQTRSTEKAALAGLDVSMPGGVCGFAAPLLEAVKAGRVPESVIDDKARRVLRVYARIGLLSDRTLTAGANCNTPAHQRVAREVAAQGIVLLKNSRHLLPLNPARLKNVLVLGPSADKRFCVIGLGGSSWVQGPYEITPLAGIRRVMGDKVQYLSTDDLGGFQPIPTDVMQPVNGAPGFQAKYFAQGGSEPAAQRVEPQVNFMWEMRSPDPKIPPAGFRAQFIGRVIPKVTGTYTIRIAAKGEAWLYVEAGGGAPVAVVNAAQGRPAATAVVEMQAGKPFDLRVDYTRQPGDAAVSLTWEPPSAPRSWAAVDAAARKADAVIVVGGIDHSLDSEGRDRTNMHFPPVQQMLINRVARQNPRTVVVLINGSPLEVGGWLPNVSSLVEAWYPGMEGGNSIADVLFGRIDPSGRLPFSWPKRLEDSPSRLLGTQNNDEVDYKEGLMVGYRYYDTKHVDPQFPFGYGLSYTTFSFGPLHAIQHNGRVSLNVTVKNTGTRAGVETVQIYVRPLKPSVSRPVHELKAFQKISLKAGESRRVDFQLGPEAFSYFDPATNQWRVDPGSYEIQAGASSREILSVAKVVVPAPAVSHARAGSQPPLDFLAIFDTVSGVGGKDFTEADLQTEMTKLKAQVGQNQGRIKVGFSHIFHSTPSLRIHCRMAKANNLSVGVIIAVQSHSGSFGYPPLLDKDYRRMQWRLDGVTWNGESVVDQKGSPEFPSRDWQVPTPSRYCAPIHDAAMAEVRREAKEIHGVMAEYPGEIAAVNACIEEELATGGEKRDDLLADYSPYAVTEFRDWLRHTGKYDDTAGDYAGQGAPAEIVGPFIRTHGALRSQFYDDPSPARSGGTGSSFNQWFGANFSTWTLRYWDLARYPSAITDKNFTPSPQTGPGATPGGFDAPRKRDPADKFWNAWSWDVPDHGGQYPPGNPDHPAFGFRQFEIKHFVADVMRAAIRAGIPQSILYAHQIPGEEVSPGRVRSGGDPIWTGRYDPSGALGITRFGPIDVAKLTQYSHDWGIFEWHTAPNMKADDHAVYDATIKALDAYVPAGGHVFFPGWWQAGGKLDSVMPLNDSQFAVALRDWIASHQ